MATPWVSGRYRSCRVVHLEAFETRLVRLPVGIPATRLASAAAVAMVIAIGAPT